MPAPIQTRAQAIAYLTERGHHAVEQDWAMGHTIKVSYGRQSAVHIGDHDVAVFEGALFIYPAGEQWAIFDAARVDGVDSTYPSLQAAVLAAEELITSQGSG